MKKVTYFALLIMVTGFTGCKESKEKMFEKAAKEITARCPRSVNEYTRLDSVVYVPGANINRYYYTLTGAADNAETILAQKTEMESALLNEVINSLEIKDYKDYDTTLEYIYYSGKNQEILFDLKIAPGQYK